MIDLSLSEMLELAREAALQRRLEEDDFIPAEAARETIPDLSVVVTLRAIRDDEGFDIPAGAQGTVHDTYANGSLYLVEFSEPSYQNRDRLGLATVKAEDIRVVWVVGDPVATPEDLRGKLGIAPEARKDGPPADAPKRGA